MKTPCDDCSATTPCTSPSPSTSSASSIRIWKTLLRLTADEALFVGDPKHRNALFALITEPS